VGASERKQLREKRAELERKLQKLAERVVGAGHPKAPGVVVHVREPVPMRDLPGTKRIIRTHDTVARIRVNDPDAEKAAQFARAIADVLETEWAVLDIGEARVFAEPDSPEFEALFSLAQAESAFE
jgi:hypothetical protein